MPHPFSVSIVQEYENWIRMRGYSLNQTIAAISWMLRHPDGNRFLCMNGQWQLCFSIRKKCPEVAELDQRVAAALVEISSVIRCVDRLDQTVFTFVLRALQEDLEKESKKLQILTVSE